MYAYQNKHQLYCGDETRVKNPIGDFTINYVELLDEDTIEFHHRHNNDYEIYYVYGGEMTFTVGDETFALQERDFVLVRPNVFHEVEYTPYQKKQYLVIIFSVDPDPAHDDTDADFWRQVQQCMKDKRFMLGHDAHGADDWIRRMISEYDKKEIGWQSILANSLVSFIADVCRNFLPASQQQREYGGTQNNLPVAITKYMHEHYMDAGLSLDRIAQELCISKRHANRLFNEYFGTTLAKTLREYRVNYAMHYLISTDYSIPRIAEKVGLSQTTLSRLFAEKTGMTMGEYREHHKIRD